MSESDVESESQLGSAADASGNLEAATWTRESADSESEAARPATPPRVQVAPPVGTLVVPLRQAARDRLRSAFPLCAQLI